MIIDEPLGVGRSGAGVRFVPLPKPRPLAPNLQILMRKTLGFVALAGLAAFAAARLAPAGLADFSKALQSAETLKADYSVQTVGGGSERFSVELKKPNLLHVETPSQILVSDGKFLTTYDKADQSYYKQPATAASVGGVFAPEGLNVWAGFFNPKALSPVSSRSLGQKSRGGQSLEGVEATYDDKGNRVVSYFLNSTDKIARQAQIDIKKGDGKTTMIVNAKDVQVGGAIPADAFAFKAPDGSRETTLEEMSSARWLTDLEEAKLLAAKTGKRIFVDFMATWCGPCKALDAQVLQTERFMEIAKKKLVLLRIDVDLQPSVMRAYGVDAMPTQMVLDAKGNVLGKTVGYGNPEAFYSFLMPNLG